MKISKLHPLLICLSLGLSSCSLAPVSKFISDTNYARSTDFSSVMYALSNNVVEKINFQELKNVSIVVTDFVNLGNLDNKSDLGFVLSSELKTVLTQKISNIELKELAISKDIKIGINGVKILSRDLSQIKSKNIKDITYIISGSYTITDKKLILYLNLINYDSGSTILSTTQTTVLTKEIYDLENENSRPKNGEIRKPLVL